MRRGKNKPKNEPVGYMKFMRPLLTGCCIGAIVCASFLMILAFGMSIKDLPQSLVEPLAVIAVSVGAFCGGFIAAKKLREKGFLVGSACGLVLFLVLVLFGINRQGIGMAGIIRLIAVLLSGAFGGILGVNIRRRRFK